MRTTTSKEWKEVTEKMQDRNSWSELAMQGKAKRNFAFAHGMRVEDVDLQEVADSKLGITGWAEVAVSVGAGDRAMPKGEAVTCLNPDNEVCCLPLCLAQSCLHCPCPNQTLCVIGFSLGFNPGSLSAICFFFLRKSTSQNPSPCVNKLQTRSKC